jgi:c-di-GMP-binding flagellar brake protein YcgR
MSVTAEETCDHRGHVVEQRDRRRSQRIELKLPVRAVEPASATWLHDRVTEDVSSGGMCIRVPRNEAPVVGEEAGFDLLIGPEAGYSPVETHVLGRAQVVRVDSCDEQGRFVAVGLSFLEPPAVGL